MKSVWIMYSWQDSLEMDIELNWTELNWIELNWVELSWVDKCMNRISDPAVHFHLDGQWILGSRFSWLHGNAIKGWNDMIPCLWPWSSALDLGPGWHSHSLIRFAFFPTAIPASSIQHPASRILLPAFCIQHPAFCIILDASTLTLELALALGR